MSTADYILAVLFLFVGLPVLAYMVMKFGKAGYDRAKERSKQRNQRKNT